MLLPKPPYLLYNRPMLKIKLKPTGKIHQRSFRIVVAPLRSKYNGKVTADLGFYTPQTNTLNLDKKELERWLKNGAQITEGVDKLLNPKKYPRVKKKKKADAKPEENKPETIEKKEKVTEETVVNNEAPENQA